MTFSLVLAFCKKNGTLIRVIDTLPWLMMWEKFQNWVLLVEKGKTFFDLNYQKVQCKMWYELRKNVQENLRFNVA